MLRLSVMNAHVTREQTDAISSKLALPESSGACTACVARALSDIFSSGTQKQSYRAIYRSIIKHQKCIGENKMDIIVEELYKVAAENKRKADIDEQARQKTIELYAAALPALI